MHPYHSYLMLIDSDLDLTIYKLFSDKIARLEADLQKAEDEINLEQAKNGPEEYKKFHLIALNRIESEITITKQYLHNWTSKKLKHIKKENIDQFFDEN
jgi:hypothetical protein